ncbi:MAG: histidine kinase N-terminal 7TM domain-containing protein, partial [Candidatus Bathyarchaeia archaeon]
MIEIGSSISFGAAALSIALAIFVLLKDHRSFLHRIFALGMISFAAEASLTGLSTWAESPQNLVLLQKMRLGVGGFIPPIWLLFSMSFGQTDYKEAIKKGKWVLLVCFIIPLLFGIGFNKYLIREVILDESSTWICGLGWMGQIIQVAMIITNVLIMMNLERTFRSSKGHMRWQIKFMIIGLGGLFALRIYTGGQNLMFRAIDMGLEVVNAGGLIVAGILMTRSLVRLKILTIDFYPSHALLYSSITLLLAGVYFIVVGVLVNLFKYLNGGHALALRVFIIFLGFLGLSVFLLSDRARHKIRYFISTHLKRPAYDYRKEWMKFTAETSMIADPETLCMKVAKMISDSLEVLSVTIWLFDETKGRLRPAGSTVFSQSGVGHRFSDEVGVKLIQELQDQEMPVDLDDPSLTWAKDFKKLIPEAIPEARVRYCARLSAAGHILGLISLGERVGYESFSFEEFDLLKTMADQLAANLLNLKFAEELRRAKEMEAFQTISAFMVHDLKNLASTLSLTLQNLP